MKDALKDKFKELNKKYGRDPKDPVNKPPISKRKLSTGNLTIDWAMVGGYEKNSVITFYGKEGSLKTTMGLKILAEAQRRGEDCVFIDVEKGSSKEYMETLGVDTKRLTIVDDLLYGEAYLDLVYDILNAADFIMIDSITALKPKAEMEADLEKPGIRAGLATLLSRALPKFLMKNSNTTILLISQLRESPKATPSGAISTYLPGGKSVHFYSDYKFKFVRKDRYDEDGNKVDASINNLARKTDVTKVNLTIVNEKNRKGPSFRVGEFGFDHMNGNTNELEEIVKISVRVGIVSLNGSYYSIEYKGDELKAQGAAKFAELIRNDTEFKEWLIKKIREALRMELKQSVKKT